MGSIADWWWQSQVSVSLKMDPHEYPIWRTQILKTEGKLMEIERSMGEYNSG